jgi:hypothetical protein
MSITSHHIDYLRQVGGLNGIRRSCYSTVGVSACSPLQTTTLYTHVVGAVKQNLAEFLWEDCRDCLPKLYASMNLNDHALEAQV